MSRTCDLCGRGARKALSRSHSNIGTIRRQRINLQTKKIGGKRVRVCTRCVRTRSKTAKA